MCLANFSDSLALKLTDRKLQKVIFYVQRNLIGLDEGSNRLQNSLCRARNNSGNIAFHKKASDRLCLSKPEVVERHINPSLQATLAIVVRFSVPEEQEPTLRQLHQHPHLFSFVEPSFAAEGDAEQFSFVRTVVNSIAGASRSCQERSR